MPPIIDHMPNRSWWRRWLHVSIAAMGWGIYAYFWLPVITALAWWVGVRHFLFNVSPHPSAQDPYLLMKLLVIALSCATTLVAWAEYNRRRFAYITQRQPKQPVCDTQVAHRLGANLEISNVLKTSRICWVETNQKAQPISAHSSRLNKTSTLNSDLT